MACRKQELYGKLEIRKMKRCLNCMEEYQEKDTVCPYCGCKENPDTPEGVMEPGSILRGRYIIGAVKRQDEADILYMGWDALFTRKVLIMEYFPENMVCRMENGAIKVLSSENEAFFSGLREFITSGRRLIILDETPGLLNVLAVTEDYGTAYVIMEFPEGNTLREMVYRYPDMCSLERVQWIVKDLSHPLSAAHRLDIFHGQVDMDHIYMLPHGNCLLGCFNGNTTHPLSADKDITALANLAGSMLAGEKAWEERSFEENMDALQEKIPPCMADALRAVLGTGSMIKPASVHRFADIFLDEATLEMT